MQCPRCDAVLPTAFPGATLACAACGAATTLPPSPRSSSSLLSAPVPLPGARPSGGPYRAASTAPISEEAETPCPYCGNGCPPLVRVCPHCDVRLDSVRCGRCYSLQMPGAFACGRCGEALELEPMLDATDAPCPRCQTPLEAAAAGAWQTQGDAPDVGRAHDGHLHECPRCGGIFVAKDALAEILTRAELYGAFPVPVRRRLVPLEEVRYLPCPQCHARMNRLNFGKLSGVIVDVCHAHGTWFDAGELTHAIAFAASGGLDRTRARVLAEKNAEKNAKASQRVEVAGLQAQVEIEDRLSLWHDLLRAFLFW